MLILQLNTVSHACFYSPIFHFVHLKSQRQFSICSFFRVHCLSEDCAKANLDDFLETRGVDNDTIVYFGYNLIWTSHKEKRQDEFGIAIGRSRDKVKNNMIQHSKRLMSINIVFHCCKIRMISGYALTEKKMLFLKKRYSTKD